MSNTEQKNVLTKENDKCNQSLLLEFIICNLSILWASLSQLVFQFAHHISYSALSYSALYLFSAELVQCWTRKQSDYRRTDGRSWIKTEKFLTLAPLRKISICRHHFLPCHNPKTARGRVNSCSTWFLLFLRWNWHRWWYDTAFTIDPKWSWSNFEWNTG